jgi:hypothetical protein
MRTKSILSILVVSAMMFAFTNVNAKGSDNGRFSVGAEVAIPGGDYGTNAGTGFGASLRYEMPVGTNLGLMGTVGYLTYGKKSIDFGFGASATYTNSMIPILVGGKYYFTEQQNGFYGMVQLGVTMLSTKYETPSYTILGTTFDGTSSTNSATAFTWSPGIGYHLDNLDFSVAYYAFSYSTTVTTNVLGVNYSATATASGSWIGIRAAYVFGSK